MTLPVKTEEICARFDAGESLADIAATIGISREVVRARLKKAGYEPVAHRGGKSLIRARMLLKHLPDLVSIKQTMEAERRALQNKIKRYPSQASYERIAVLHDHIHALEQITL